MKLLSYFLSTAVQEGEDLSTLPPIKNDEIKKNIRKGAKDTTQKWANALELVQKAYEVASVERPTPDMSGAWKQYEENIQYAVQQLAKIRGIDGDWRMSASIFHEADQWKAPDGGEHFKIFLDVPGAEGVEAFVIADSIEDVITTLKRRVAGDPRSSVYTIKVEKTRTGKRLTFWLHGIRKNYFVRITPHNPTKS